MNKKRVRNNKGQLQLSFGMIFSIVLIIIFLAFGFYAIKKFVDLQHSIQIESFLRDFQDDIDTMWKSTQGSQNLVYTLPAKIDSVCFREDEFQNLEFMSKNIISGKMIEHINIEEIIKNENPYCIQNVKGKISLRIIKDYGETLVKVKR